MRAWILLLILAAPVAAQGSEDLREMAANVRDYPTKFKLITIGRPAIPYLLAQMEHENEWIVFESQSTVRWIVNHSLRDPKQKRILAEELTLYCAERRPAAARIFAAELLGDLGVVSTIGTLTAMLRAEETVARAAVDALRRIPDPAASNALVSSLNGAAAPVRDAIYSALGARGEKRSLHVLLKAAAEANPAAIQALGDSGFGEAEEVLRRAHEQGSKPAFDALVKIGRTRADAPLLVRTYALTKDDGQRRMVIDAAEEVAVMDMKMLDVLAGAMEQPTLRVAAQHAILGIVEKVDRTAAAPFCRMILKDAAEQSVVLRALAGCARTKDAQAVDLVLPHLASKSLNVRTTAIGALRDIPGKRATRALLDVAGKEATPTTQKLIIDALGDRGDPAAAKALEAWMKEGPDEVRKAAVDAYVRIAAKAAGANARAMYMRALDAGATGAAVAGLGRVGDATSLPAIEKVLATAEGADRAAAVDALVAIGTRLEQSGRGQDAVRALKRALDAGAPVENQLRLLGEKVTFTAREGFITAWWLIGPFPAANVDAWSQPEFPEQGVDLKAQRKIGDATVMWRPVQGTSDRLDLNTMFLRNDFATAYAYAEIMVRKERDALLKVGSDDGIRCWLNGKLVHSNLALRGLVVDQDEVKIHLNQGMNTLLIKVCEQQGGWEFAARLMDDQGRPLKFKYR